MQGVNVQISAQKLLAFSYLLYSLSETHLCRVDYLNVAHGRRQIPPDPQDWIL